MQQRFQQQQQQFQRQQTQFQQQQQQVQQRQCSQAPEQQQQQHLFQRHHQQLHPLFGAGTDRRQQGKVCTDGLVCERARVRAGVGVCVCVCLCLCDFTVQWASTFIGTEAPRSTIKKKETSPPALGMKILSTPRIFN
jgi:hypothetical protein